MNEMLVDLHEQRCHFASLLSKGSSLMILAAGIVVVKSFKFRLMIAGPTIDDSGCDRTGLTENIP
jgi:hypothetical protein